MSLPTHIQQTYTAILREELVPAMGCTEPIAIAYAAAILRHALGADPTTLRVELSGNIIKNVKSVIVPATDGMHGIEAAVAAGIVAGCPDRKLEVLCALKPADADRIRDFLAATTPAVSELETKHPFELVMTGEATVEGQAVTVTVHLMDRHTNVVSVDRNGEDLTDRYLYGESLVHTEPADRSLLNVQDIITYAEEVDLDEVKPLLERQIAMNMAIAEEGLRCEYGASIGRLLYNGGHCDLRTKARAYAAAGSDARMNGCELPVCIISGSGNQGMTASVPVVVYAKAWHTDNETLLRALLVSNLITVHQKTGIGCLSAYCGAISAGVGAGAGITYLYGGKHREIAHTIVNALAIDSGIICDGAKASCAAKISSAIDAALFAHVLAMQGKVYESNTGILRSETGETISCVGHIGKVGMRETDKQIINLMLK